MEDRISAFLIVKNEYENIGLALGSLFGRVDEIVLIDDASPMPSLHLSQYLYWELVYNNAGYSFKYHISETNEGYNEAHFQRALEMASYPWLFHLDGDEILASDSHNVLREDIQRGRQRHGKHLQAVKCMMYPILHGVYGAPTWRYDTKDIERVKVRLYHRESGHFSGQFDSEWIRKNQFGMHDGRHIIYHVRSEEEKKSDELRYSRLVGDKYLAAQNDQEKEHYRALYTTLRDKYGWQHETIEDHVENGAF